jgi:hypothetical protein
MWRSTHCLSPTGIIAHEDGRVTTEIVFELDLVVVLVSELESRFDDEDENDCF